MEAKPATAGLKILLVDDNPTDAAATLLMLESLGCKAELVGNGADAIASVQQKSYDVVLMDVQMRGLNGFQATKQIRETVPVARRPRIIALTARSIEGDREACLAAGMDDYIAKPCNPQMLAKAISAHTMRTVDPEILKNYARAMKPEAVAKLVDAYLKDLPRMIGELRTAVAAAKPTDVADAAHALKSASEVTGAKLLALLAKQLEHAGRIGQLEGAAELLAKIEALQQPVDTELRALHKRPGS